MSESPGLVMMVFKQDGGVQRMVPLTRSRSGIGALICGLCAASAVHAADPAPFDLSGPTLDVRVTHGATVLPIAETPNLSPGDSLWIRPDFPPGQSAHYLMIVAFLQGATDPPPQAWFHQWKSWDRKTAKGVEVPVPAGAQQALLFLAPDTGGGFDTLVKAVRGRPGAFVRASQDLNQAMLDRSRLDAFVAAVRRISEAEPHHLGEASPLLARSLAIKLDPACLQKVTEDQAPCLTSGQDSLVLDDGQSISIVQALTSGYSADLIQQLSDTPRAGYGYYSPYIASVMDIARILEAFHTAQYQYLPALASIGGERLSLLLNAPPSFKNPMSVLVVALPPIAPPQPPPLRPVDAKAAYCLAGSDLVLPMEGAPLVYSTAYAHDMVLRFQHGAGPPIELPVQADAEKGGLVAGEAAKAGAAGADSGELEGQWGFAPFKGPRFSIRWPKATSWRRTGDEQQPLIAGRDTQVVLSSPQAPCVDGVALQSADGSPVKLDWKVSGPDQLTVTLPLKDRKPGALTLLVSQHGVAAPDRVDFDAFAQPADLDAFVYHAGDGAGVLKGRRLRQVAGLKVGGVNFKPGKLETTPANAEQLELVAPDAAAAGKLAAGATLPAEVVLKDGRALKLETAIEAARPSVALIGESAGAALSLAPLPIVLEDKDELPFGAKLTFSLRAETPASFSGDEKVEIARSDGALLTTLTLQDGLMLEDPSVLIGQLDSAKLGPSAFGALQFRIVEAGAPGDWRPLVQLVRAPVLRGLKCPDPPDQTCQLSGENLFLVAGLSADPGFAKGMKAPDGFTGEVLPAPRPTNGRLYVKLRDDPAVVNQIVLPEPAVGAAVDVSKTAKRGGANGS